MVHFLTLIKRSSITHSMTDTVKKGRYSISFVHLLLFQLSLISSYKAICLISSYKAMCFRERLSHFKLMLWVRLCTYLFILISTYTYSYNNETFRFTFDALVKHLMLWTVLDLWSILTNSV